MENLIENVPGEANSELVPQRRGFLKKIVMGMALLPLFNRVMGQKSNPATVQLGSKKPFEEMRPGEIQEALEIAPYAFVPVSPMIEWHSYHLPMGTDGLISEAICQTMAEKLGGVWFRPLSFGLDSWRGDDQKVMWGFSSDERVFGMNFPDVPLVSEYCKVSDLKKAVENRVKALRGIGIKHIFLLNHHGGKGQIPTIEELGKELSDDKISVHGLKTYQFNDLTEDEGFYGVGGHAGYAETTWLMAFRPELIDLTKLNPGELSVRKTGILHNKPLIEEKWNPGNVSSMVAKRLKHRVVDNFIKYISSTK